MRTFISINISENLKSEIQKIQKSLQKEIEKLNPQFLKALKWEPMEKFHLTLFFIGEVSEEKINKIHDLLLQTENSSVENELSFKANGINAFPNLKFPRVIVLKLENPDKRVFKLAERIGSSMKEIGLISDKAFKPHITVARIKRENKINLTELQNFPETNLEFSAKNFYLMKSNLKSTGSEYEVLKEYKISL